jgi:acyl carrier protein
VKSSFDDGEDWAHHHVMLVLSDRLGRDPSSISPDERLSDLGFDSLDAVELVMAIEDEFQVTVHDEDQRRLETVQDLIDLVRRLRG